MIGTSIGLFKNNKRSLLLFLGLFLFLAFMATMSASFFVSRGAIREAIISRELPLTSDNIYSEIQNDLILPRDISSTMANNTFLQEWVIEGEADINRIKRYLSEIKNKYNAISSFFISEKTKRYYYSGGVLKTVKRTESRDNWYFRVREMESPYEINVDPDMANSDTITIFINYKVFDFNNNYIGATGVGLTAENLRARIKHYQDRYQRTVFFVDRGGDIVLFQNGQTRFKEGDNIRNIKGLSNVADQILGHDNATLEYPLDQTTIFLKSRYIPEIKWYLMVEQDAGGAIQPLVNVLYVNIAIGLVVTLIVLTTIALMVIRFQKNLEIRNLALEAKNKQIKQQRQQLEVQKEDLEEINQQLEHLNQEKDEFLGIAAHDLRSPLSGIIAAVELSLNQKSTEADKIQYNDYIIKTATNMLDLIVNLLDVSTIDMTKNLVTVKTDFSDTVLKAVKTFDIHAKTKQVSIQTFMPEKPLLVMTHMEWLPHIISNLISNAVKYSPENSLIEVNLSGEAGFARFSVKDQGPGLTVEDKKVLFSRFARLSPRPTGGESSSGLGLYIVKKLTERLGGNVWCESEYGFGSHFFVDIPLINESQLPPA